jgi:acyl-coenzyme A synthetase/AMP-(fatty) acid ligase
MISSSDERATDGTSGPPPSTADYVRFHALHRPESVALIDNGRDITYGRFYADLKKLTSALRHVLPPAARSAAVECGQLYLHWLLLLACENLGVVTASLQSDLMPISKATLDFVDMVICEHDVPAAWASKTYQLKQAWVSGVLAQSEPDERHESPNAVMKLSDARRILRSSGTTGVGKMMVASRSLEEVHIQTFIMHMGFSKDTRYLITGYFTVASMYWRATACLRLGATCVFEGRTTLAQAIAAHKPTHVRLFQYQVKLVLDELPPTYQKPERLTVMMGAGPLPDDMRRQIMARLATDLVYTYNSNETCMIGVVDAEGIVTLRPGVDAEVIDEHGRPLPPGEVGRLKIRTDTLVDGYADDPDATARAFVDGWFHSNDMGVLVGPRRLKILGRIDDVLNIGGMKIVPSVVEDMILAVAPVQEAGATSIRGPDGIDEICIAVVPIASADLSTIEATIAAKVLPRTLGRAHVMAMDQLPRTDTGKLQRHLLKAAFQARMRGL